MILELQQTKENEKQEKKSRLANDNTDIVLVVVYAFSLAKLYQSGNEIHIIDYIEIND